MPKDSDMLQMRTRTFGLRVINMVEALPRRRAGMVIGDQLLRAGTSVGANYRAACGARSVAEFCAKLGIVEEEADEAIYWIELAADAGLVPRQRVTELLQEANAILAMVVASIRTARNRKTRQK